MKKNQSGITLVALVITIIILIILATVSIKSIIDFNIIAKASEGAEKYAVAQNEEMKEFEKLSEKFEIQAEDEGLQGNISIERLEEIIQNKFEEELKNKEQEIKLSIYPIGSIYLSIEGKNPSELFGGEWESYGEGRTIVGVGKSDKVFTAGEIGGESNHRLTIGEMPSHNHSISYNVGTAQNPHGTRYGFPKGSSDWINIGTQYTDNSGGSNSHNNLQPYIVAYMWKRIA